MHAMALGFPNMDETGAADRISSLPDDLLHLVLLRLDCARSIARARVLSRQWRRVCSRIPIVILNNVPLRELEAALRRAAAPGVRVRLLDITVPNERTRQPADIVSSVLRAAAALEPMELRFTFMAYLEPGASLVELPHFHRASSIELHGLSPSIHVAQSGFPLLERLSLFGSFPDLAALIPCCPRLHVLTVDDFTVHSASLQKLLVERLKPFQRGVTADVLKKLTTQSLDDKLRSTILAPMVDKVSLRFSYKSRRRSTYCYGLGLWSLDLLEVGLESPERHGAAVLSLHMCAKGSHYFQYADDILSEEIFKHMCTHFSDLNLHLTTRGHMLGAFVLRLLGINCHRGINYHGLRLTDIRNLKIVILRSSEVKEEACPLNCPCDDPKGWRSQVVSLNNLEKVSIEGFKGEDHELDLLRVIFRCAPMLKSVTLSWLPHQDMPTDDWCTKVNNIFWENPYVEGNIDVISGITSGGTADLISILPDYLLLQVLKRLNCARAAVRTCSLSRRWHRFWTRLPKTAVTLHDVLFSSLEDALHCATRPGVFHRLLLDISVPWHDGVLTSSSVSSLLQAACRLAPVELRFTLQQNLQVDSLDVDLPRLDCATSIDLCVKYLRLAPPLAGAWYPLLKRLSLSGCHVDLASLIPRCPCLRLLTVNTTGLVGMDKLTMHSQSLQELVVESSNTWTSCIDIDAPVLKQLTVYFHTRGHLRISILPPPTEAKVAWRCLYERAFYRLGLWGLLEVGLNTNQRHSLTDSWNCMSLHMCAHDSFNSRNVELRFESEIHKHMFIDFSGLDLHLTTKGHAFGALVLRLLGMNRIRTAIRNLKIVLLRSEVKDACQVNCDCDEPKDWRTQTISLSDLENLDIEGIAGEDHEFDFLKVVFTCALMLKRVTLRLADGITPCVDWCSKVNNIFMAYPFVECKIYLVSRTDAWLAYSLMQLKLSFCGVQN